jgi:cell division septation protein DedD
MMQTETKTRTQRRLEKRQTIILLALLLLASLLSFVLGVTTGRRGAERDFAQQVKDRQEEVRIVQVPAAPPVPAPAPPQVEKPGEEKGALIDTVVENARLSFYDDLVRDSSPLGSGINQPPPEENRTPATPPPLELADQPIVMRDGRQASVQAAPVRPVPQLEQTPSAAALAPADPVLPAVTVQGSHVVQVGSFGSAADAASLRQRMLDKGYPAFLAEADLGERGVWYRVRIGPFADSAAAGVARQIILDKEQIEGLVTRHTR